MTRGNAGARLARLLAWMEGQDFSHLVRSGRLKEVEEIVVDAHRRLYQARGKPWTPPAAYRWLRYEDPAPVNRLAEGVERLRKRGAAFDAEAVDKACARAPKRADLN